MKLLQLIADLPFIKDLARFKYINSDLACYPYMLHVENQRALSPGTDYYTVTIRLTSECRHAISFAELQRELVHLYEECDDMVVFVRMPEGKRVYISKVDSGIVWVCQ